MKLLILLIAAVLLDYKIGDPAGWPHPIIYIGKLISVMKRVILKMKLDNRFGGLLLWLLSNGIVLAVLTVILEGAGYIHEYLKDGLVLYFMFASLAATCLGTEVKKVGTALTEKGIEEGRKRLSYLVGRDTSELSEEEVIKAAIETTAENTIDGILAPLFYLGIGIAIGYPVQAVFLYKTVNTLDSMVGYIQEPYTRIGYVSAKLDDLFNLIPARIGSFIMLLAGGVIGENISKGMKVWKRDRYNHKSPNAGFPEAAVAGLLNIQLGGSHTYFGQVLDKPTIGDKDRDVTIRDIDLTVRIMYMAEFIMLMMMVVLIWLVAGR